MYFQSILHKSITILCENMVVSEKCYILIDRLHYLFHFMIFKKKIQQELSYHINHHVSRSKFVKLLTNHKMIQAKFMKGSYILHYAHFFTFINLTVWNPILAVIWNVPDLLHGSSMPHFINLYIYKFQLNYCTYTNKCNHASAELRRNALSHAKNCKLLMYMLYFRLSIQSIYVC
jgi:hypothetical protein